MKVRVKLNCVVEMPRIPNLDGEGVLDVVARAVAPFGAKAILPGTRLSFNKANETPLRKTKRKP